MDRYPAAMLLLILWLPLIAGVVVAAVKMRPSTPVAGGQQPTTVTASPVRRGGGASMTDCVPNAADIDMLQSNVPRPRAMSFDEVVHLDLSRGVAKRLTFEIDQPSPLHILLTPPLSFLVVRKLFYNQSANILTSCLNVSLPMTLPCARPGRYDLLLQPSYAIAGAYRQTATAINVQVNRYNRFANWSQLDDMEATTVIRYHNRVQRRQMMVKWERSKLDSSAIHYCLVVSMQRNQRSLCAALSTAPSNIHRLASLGLEPTFRRPNASAVTVGELQKPLVICTARKSRQQLNGLMPNRRYFIDVFGIHTLHDSLTFRMGSTSVWFNRTQPTVLPDDTIVTARLAELGRQTVFSFRVPRTAVGAQRTLLQVLPCGIGLFVKVFLRKELLVEHEVDRPMAMQVQGTRPGDRLVIKVSASDQYEFRRTQRVGIAATVAPRFSALPELPNNTSVEQISPSCAPTTLIAWFASPDVRTVRYCVALVRVISQTYFNEDLSSSNVCENGAALASSYPHNGHTRCFSSSYPRDQVESFDLGELKAGSLYSVHVTVQYANISLPYELLRLSTNPFCYQTDADAEKVTSREEGIEAMVAKHVDGVTLT